MGEPKFRKLKLKKNNRLQYFELLIACLLWGLGFVATTWCLESLTPAWVVTLRFFFSFILSFLYFYIFKRKPLVAREILPAVIPALILFGILFLTALGQRTTTATNSGFITCLYILFVPVIEMIHRKVRISYWHGALIFCALIGTAMICRLEKLILNPGDFFIFLGSIIAAYQIYYLGLISNKIESGFIFNTWQSFFGFLPALILALSFEPLPYHLTAHSIWGLAIVSIGSTVIAFALQVRAQRTIPPTTAAIIYQLESPISAIFAFWLLGERLDSIQLLGAALIFASAIGAGLLHRAEMKSVGVLAS